MLTCAGLVAGCQLDRCIAAGASPRTQPRPLPLPLLCPHPLQLADGGNMRRSTRLQALYTDRRRRNVLFDNLHHRGVAHRGGPAELRSGLALLAAAEWCAGPLGRPGPGLGGPGTAAAWPARCSCAQRGEHARGLPPKGSSPRPSAPPAGLEHWQCRPAAGRSPGALALTRPLALLPDAPM